MIKSLEEPQILSKQRKENAPCLSQIWNIATTGCRIQLTNRALQRLSWDHLSFSDFQLLSADETQGAGCYNNYFT